MYLTIKRETARELALAARRQKDDSVRIEVGYELLGHLHDEIADDREFVCRHLLKEHDATLRGMSDALKDAKYTELHMQATRVLIADLMRAAFRLGWTAALVQQDEPIEMDEV